MDQKTKSYVTENSLQKIPRITASEVAALLPEASGDPAMQDQLAAFIYQFSLILYKASIDE